MIKIKDFAKLSRVTERTLRYYEEMGLFQPARIDRVSGYRYYRFAQLARLNRILALKELGFSLEQVAELLNEDLPLAQLQGMFRLKQEELQQQIKDAKERLGRLEARLQQIEQEGIMTQYDVVIRSIDALRVASLKDVIPNQEQISTTFNRLFDELCAYMVQHEAKFSGPGLDLWIDPGTSDHDMRVEVAYPTVSVFPESERVKIVTLPGVETMACVVHHGPFTGISQAYGAILAWIEQNGYTINGPSREVYLHYERTGDPAKYVTELQFPVIKA